MERPRNFESQPAEITVTPATNEDMPSLIDIMGDPEDLEYMMETQEKDEGTFFIAKEDEKIVGAVLLATNYQSKYNSDINGNHFAGMIVSEDSRRRGIGGELLSACENKVRELGGNDLKLSVSKNNDNAISFYEKYGYAKIPDSDYIVTDEGGEGSAGQENYYMKKEL